MIFTLVKIYDTLQIKLYTRDGFALYDSDFQIVGTVPQSNFNNIYNKL